MRFPFLLIPCLLLAACRPGGAKSSGPAGPPPPPKLQVARPLARQLTDYDDFIGRLSSPKSVQIRARVSGYLSKVHFAEGTEVKANDLLFTIDPRPYQAIVDQFQADRDSAKARADLAEAEVARANRLLASKAIAGEEFDQRSKALVEAKAAVRSVDAKLAAANLDLSFTKITSPITGRISSALVNEGNLVNGGTTSPTLLTTVVSLDPIYCEVEVDEASSLKYRDLYRQGKRPSALYGKVPARMGLANQEGYPHEGFLDFVDNQLRADTGTIRARAVFPNKDHLMAPGFFARLRIPGSGEYSAFLVREISLGSDQGQAFVWVLDEKKTLHQRVVKTGPLEEGMRTVTEGITEKDLILVNGLQNAREGLTIEPEEVPMKVVVDPNAPKPVLAPAKPSG